MNALAALLSLVPLQSPMSFGSGGVDDFILTEKQAYMVLPPQAVGGPQTVTMNWSPSGRYLLLGRLNPPINAATFNTVLSGGRPQKPVLAISIWDKVQNRTSDLGSIPIESGQKFTWVAGKDVTLDLLTEELPGDQERASILRIDAASGKLSFIPLANPVAANTLYRVEVSPAAPSALVIETSFSRERNSLPQVSSLVWVVDDQGRSRAKAQLPNGHPDMVRWSKDGRAMISFFRPATDGKGAKSLVSFDLASGSVTPLTKEEPWYESREEAAPLTVERAMMQSSAGTMKKVLRSFWLKSAKPSEQGEYLLAPRADAAFLNTSTDAVAILDQGVVTVRALISVPKETYLQAKTAAEKAKALSDVKQIGTAAHMFGADNDDRFPSPEEFQSRVLHPYMKNDATFEGFVYTFAGGSYNGIKDPVGTVLGYKPAAGGFAVVFADGHARWLKELPKNS